MKILQEYTLKELKEEMDKKAVKRFRAEQIFSFSNSTSNFFNIFRLFFFISFGYDIGVNQIWSMIYHCFLLFHIFPLLFSCCKIRRWCAPADFAFFRIRYLFRGILGVYTLSVSTFQGSPRVRAAPAGAQHG